VTFNHRRILTAILIAAFLARLVVAYLLPDQGFPDAQGYREAGLQFWRTFHIGSTYIMPLYPILVGITGAGWGQFLLDAALSTLAVWLIDRLAFVLFADHLIAIIAAAIAAIYPYFIFYAAVGLTEPLFIALLLAAFLSWYRGAFFAAAIFAVLGILTRPAIELLAPLLVAYFACAVHGLGIKGAARQLAVYGAVYVALMSPWWLHNDAAYGSFVRLNLGSGFLFYAGNNPLSHTGGGLVDIDWNNHAFDTISDPIARDRAYRDAAITYIKEHPARFVELAWIKFTRFWQLWPYAQEYRSNIYVIVSLLSYGPVLLFSLAYLAFWGSQDLRKIAPILMFIAYLTVVHSVFVSSIRYRLPVEPFLIIFASVTVRRAAIARLKLPVTTATSAGNN
jgi:4-amino-4-deoxy-L-arabinose transferase-like glycosyltransferase